MSNQGHTKGALKGHEAEIIKMRAAKISFKEIAAQYEVSIQAVEQLLQRRKLSIFREVFAALKYARLSIDANDPNNNYLVKIVDAALKKGGGL